MSGPPTSGWIAVPAIDRWVAIDLSRPDMPGWRAAAVALSLPELRAFARAALGLGIDATAPAGEWTSTCIERRHDPTFDRWADHALHHSRLRRGRGGSWILGSPLSETSRISARLPSSGWAVSRQCEPWIDESTGLPLATIQYIDPDAQSDSTGYSYFWEPDPCEGITMVIRECERLHGDVMDISAAIKPEHHHEDIQLRRAGFLSDQPNIRSCISSRYVTWKL